MVLSTFDITASRSLWVVLPNFLSIISCKQLVRLTVSGTNLTSSVVPKVGVQCWICSTSAPRVTLFLIIVSNKMLNVVSVK